MIVAGVDITGPRLITIDPSGSYRGYKAAALGANSEKARDLLEKQYKDGIKLKEAMSLTVESLKLAHEGLKPTNVNSAVIPIATKTFSKVPEEDISKLF